MASVPFFGADIVQYFGRPRQVGEERRDLRFTIYDLQFTIYDLRWTMDDL